MSLANGALRKVLEGRPPAPAAKPKAKSEDPRPILERVWRSPRDPATLAVFADWLLLQGEATRGEYIGLALLPKPTPEQRARAERLRAKDRGRWLGEARKLVSEWGDSDTSPGFVAWATVSADNLLAHFDALRALGPELTLRLTPVKTRLMTKKLAQLPLGELHGLHFYNTKGTYGMNRDWLDDTSLGILSPALVGLRALVLAPAIQANEGEGFTPRALEHLRPLGATLASLTVDFSESDPTPDLLAALAPAVFPKLETLTIVGLPGARRRGLKAAWSKSEAELVFG